MFFLNLFLTCLFSVLSTAILSYISMAVMIGPWIHVLIVITTSLIFSLLRLKLSAENRVQSISLITAGSSIGGILATGCGFAFPTLYFLNKELFNQWIEIPLYFVAVMALLSFSAGTLGFLVANFFEEKLIVEDKLPFPIGEVNYNLATSQESSFQTYQLIAGSFISALYSFGIWLFHVAQKIALTTAHTLGKFTLPALALPAAEFPLLLAIGFIAGSMITGPLAVGLLSKILLMNPLHAQFFDYLESNNFSFAFISGMVFFGAVLSLLELPKFFKGMVKKVRALKQTNSTPSMQTNSYAAIALALISIILFLSWFKFNPLLQVYLIAFTALCAYQLLIIGGEIGLAPVGRYATFVMMPALFIFTPSYEQLALLSTFVEVCGGVAIDILFGRKFARMANTNSAQVRSFQWLGLIISSLAVGIIFLILIKKFGLGSSQLIAQRSQTRALQIQFQEFDFYAMTVGALFGSLLKEFKINPVMVLGGILMPLEWVVVLIAGGCLSMMTSKAKEYQVFWSGIFAVNSLVMIIKALW